MLIVHTARETGSAHALIKYERLLTFLVLAGLRRCAVVFHQLYKPPHVACARLPAVRVLILLHLHGIRLAVQAEDNTGYQLAFKLGQVVY